MPSAECRRRFLEVADRRDGEGALKKEGRRGSEGGAVDGEGTERLSAAEVLTGSLG